MAGRTFLSRAEPGFTLPAFERLAPPPPPDLVAARLEAASEPGDIVADLHGRGGWVARAATGRQRRAFSLESNPLTRLLAEVVLRPPDLRHLDAAFSALGASPRGETSLRLSIAEMFASRCPTCGRNVTVEEFTWTAQPDAQPADVPEEPARPIATAAPRGFVPADGLEDTPPAHRDAAGPDADPAAPDAAPEARVPTGPAPTRKAYRCTVCRDQRGGSDLRSEPLDAADLRRARKDVGASAVRRRLLDRFPVPSGGGPLAREILDLHTDRQLVGLAAILERIERDLRAAPVESALRLAFLHAVLPASRLAAAGGRVPAVRIASGSIRTPLPDPWRERNPWVAFEDGFRSVRAFVQRLEGGQFGGLETRLGTDLRSLAEGPAAAVLRVMTPSALDVLAEEAREPGREPGSRGPARPRIKLVLGQPPARFSQERLGAAYLGTCWALGREAASLLPLEPLLGAPIRAPWSWQAAALRRSLEAAAPHIARDGRVVLLLESGGQEALVAAVLGGVGAGYRVIEARLAEADEEVGGIVELVPPGGSLPPGARTRANASLVPEAGERGDPEVVPGPGLFAAPERIDARPFSPAEAARSVTDTAVEVLKARGEPARYERLLGEILVGLDRSGQLRRLVAADPGGADDGAGDRGGDDPGVGQLGGTGSATEPSPAARALDPFRSPTRHTSPGGFGPLPSSLRSDPAGPARRPLRQSVFAPSPRPPAADPVERVLALVRDELARPTQRRVVEVEPGRWWLTERTDREAAAVPLADRVEWAVYSLLSTAGPIAETAFFERIASIFAGHDLPDEALVRACLASYRSPASTPDRLTTAEDPRQRAADHTELLALLANAGHRLRMSVSLGRREQTRRVGSRTLAEYLDVRERESWQPAIAGAPIDVLEAVDCMWYVRAKMAILWEVEWTAMLGDLMLRRHGRIRPSDHVARILAVAPERLDLVRHRLETSPLLRTAVEEAGWRFILWPHLRAWLAREPLDLASLEPYLGLDPAILRRGEQLGLFEGPDAVR
jgi:hypothetical protein